MSVCDTYILPFPNRESNSLLSFRLAANFSETLIDEMMQRCYKPDAVVAEITRTADAVEMRLTDVPTAEKLEKFVEDVRWDFKEKCADGMYCIIKWMNLFAGTASTR